MLRLINEERTIAPESSDGGMDSTPLAASLDWMMGTTAGFAAYREQRIDGTPKRILDA